VDDFNKTRNTNLLGGSFGTFTNPGTRYVESSLVDVLPSSGKSSNLRNRALQLTFDTTRPDSYGGYWTSIASANISDYSSLAFRMFSNGRIPNFIAGIRTKQGIEGRASVLPYISNKNADGWNDVRIPLTGLRGISEFSSPDVLFFSFSDKDGSGKGTVRIEDLRFEREPFYRVADFESPFNWTLLGGDYATLQNGAAAIATNCMKDLDKQDNTVLRISYGGSIGRDYGMNGGFSYAGWRAGLNGIDVRQSKNLVMRIRGERGGELPNVYLSDLVRRIPIRAKEIQQVTKDWQTIKVPLDFYGGQGVDLSHLDSLEIVFEWTEQSGTIYVDDIRFE
jgi:hypothetical protein